MPKNLELLFKPSSIAVIGASREKQKVGNIVVRNLIDGGFQGNVYPVNPNATDINGITCYKDIASIPNPADVIIIAVPAAQVIEIVRSASVLGHKNFVIYSAGFKEVGDEGANLEETLAQLAVEHELNILGPNCLGYFSNENNVNATFGNAPKTKGNVKFISQSGAIATAMFDWAEHHHLGFSEFITLGNKTALNENDVLSYFEQHAGANEPIGIYLESLTDGKKFLSLVSKLITTHPIFMLKPGKSDASKKAMLSHTGSLAGEDDVLDAALKEAGVIKCSGLEQLFALTQALSWQKAPASSSVVVVSNAGGPAVISADLLVEHGLNLAVLSSETKAILEDKLPRHAGIMNPVDVLGDALAERYKIALEAVLNENNVSSVLILLTPQVMTQIEETAEAIGNVAKSTDKTVICSFIGGGKTAIGTEILSKYRIPSFSYPERAITVLSQMWQWQEFINRPVSQIFETSDTETATLQGGKKTKYIKVKKTIDAHITKKKSVLDTLTANEILSTWNINVPKMSYINSLGEAMDFAQGLNYPVVLKLSSEHIVHKTEQKAVIANIKNQEELKSAYSEIKKLNEVFVGAKVVIQKHIVGGIELIAGIKNDIAFGPVLMFGAGGKYVELMQDKNFALLPLTKDKAMTLVQKSKVYKLIKGYRGEEPYAIDKLINDLLDLSDLVQNFPQISEVEINPIILTQESMWAVDGRIILK